MRRARNIGLYGIACILVTACNSLVVAQTASFTASASAEKIGVQDRVQVTYTIQNVPNLQSIDKIVSADFDIAGGPFTSQSTNISMVGNRTVQSQSVSLTYILQPKHTGNLTIPASNAKDAAGHSYQSNSIPLQVVGGTLASAQQRRQQASQDPFGQDPFGQDPFAAYMQHRQQQLQRMQQQQQRMQQAQNRQQALPKAEAPADINKDLFIRVTVDKSKVHVGEQVTASYKLYSRIPMQVGISKLPSLNGFWTQDFEIPKQPRPVEEVVDGKKYQVFLLKKSALFPQQTGTLELDPAEAQGMARMIQQVKQRNPFADMFDDPFFQNAMGGSLMMNDPLNNFFNTVAYRDVQVHLKSTPVKIQVTALPDKGKPENYGGAVGSFTASSKIDKKELSTDETANLQLTITGSGNLKLIEAPKLNLPNGLDGYDPQIIDTITGRSTTISGSKIITYPIAPRTPGDYNIPATDFSYYDPQAGSYVTLHTQPLSLHVKPGKNYNPAVAKNNKPLTDIHNIETKPLTQLVFNSKPLLFSPGYWSMYALPLLAFVGIVFWKRRDEELSKDIVKLRNRRANKIALKRLVTAQKLLKQNSTGAFYEEISKAIWLYLSDKLNIPLSSLSHETARTALEERKVPVNLQQKMQQVVNECETALYASAGGSQQMQLTYDNAITVISQLEETINT